MCNTPLELGGFSKAVYNGPDTKNPSAPENTSKQGLFGLSPESQHCTSRKPTSVRHWQEMHALVGRHWGKGSCQSSSWGLRSSLWTSAQPATHTSTRDGCCAQWSSKVTCLPTVVTGAAAQEDTRDREQQVTCWLPPRISRISGGCSGETPLYWLLFPIPTSLERGWQCISVLVKLLYFLRLFHRCFR